MRYGIAVGARERRVWYVEAQVWSLCLVGPVFQQDDGNCTRHEIKERDQCNSKLVVRRIFEHIPAVVTVQYVVLES
jgi:hypothetical protein